MDQKIAKNTNNTIQAFWVSLGSLFAFGFGIVSSMILSRYFSKKDYGTYKQVLYVYNTMLSVFTLGLPKAFSYFLPRIPIAQAKNLIRKLTNLFLLLGGCFSFVLFIFSAQLAAILKNPDLTLAIKIFSPVPLFLLPTMGLEGILASYRQTQFMALYTILNNVFKLLCVALPVVIFKGGYIQAIIGFVAASFISFLVALYLKFLPVRNAGNEKCPISYKEIFSFSLPLMFASLWGTLIGSIDQFFISRYFGTEIFAEFSTGSMELPFVGMIIGATSTVLMPLFSKKVHEEADPKKEILPVWINAFEKTAIIVYPLVLYCWFFADIIMVVLYGQKYSISAIYFRIKLLNNFFTLVAYAPVILALGATKFYSNVHMISAIILVPLEYISILIFHSPYVVTLISVILSIGRTFIFLAFIARFFRIRIIDLFPIKLITRITLPSLCILALVRYIFMRMIVISNLSILLITFIIYLCLYGVWAYIGKIDYLSIIKVLIKNDNT